MEYTTNDVYDDVKKMSSIFTVYGDVLLWNFHIRISTKYTIVGRCFYVIFDPEQIFRVWYSLVLVINVFFLRDHNFHFQWDGLK